MKSLNNGRKYDCDIRPQNLSFNFVLPKDVDEDLNCEIEFIIESNESLAGFIMKNKTEQLLLKYKRKETIFMKTENSRTNEPHKFVLNL